MSPRRLRLRFIRGTCTCLAAALLIGGAAGAAEPTLVRAPYLQTVGDDGGLIAWRTDVATSSRLDWGPAPGVVTHRVSETAPVTDHVLAVTGLLPGETVYYQVGTAATVLAGGDADHALTAGPDPASSADVSLWVIGDSGAPGSDADHVRDAYLAASSGAPAAAWLLLGDNAYYSGTEAEYDAAFFGEYGAVARRTSAWPALGNHDSVSSASASQTGPFFTAFILPTGGQLGGVASETEAWGSCDLGLVHLVRLDSSDSSLAPGSAMLAWLAADLAATDRPWTIAFFHHPPYTEGSHDSDDPLDSGGRMQAVRENVLPVLEGAGVDLVLSGHSHAYERSHLLDGHYGDSSTFDPGTMELDAGDGDPAGDGAYVKVNGAHGGAVYAVVGSSSRLNPGPFGHPAMPVALASLGSLMVTVAGDALDARFVDDTGTERDRFVIVKHGAPFFADGFESASAASWSVTPAARPTP